jgi:hypothetical protein
MGTGNLFQDSAILILVFREKNLKGRALFKGVMPLDTAAS